MKTYTFTEKVDTRSGFGSGLTELGKSNKNVVALCADLTGSLKMDDFKNNHPDRFFQVRSNQHQSQNVYQFYRKMCMFSYGFNQ